MRRILNDEYEKIQIEMESRTGNSRDLQLLFSPPVIISLEATDTRTTVKKKKKRKEKKGKNITKKKNIPVKLTKKNNYKGRYKTRLNIRPGEVVRCAGVEK